MSLFLLLYSTTGGALEGLTLRSANTTRISRTYTLGHKRVQSRAVASTNGIRSTAHRRHNVHESYRGYTVVHAYRLVRLVLLTGLV